MELLEILSDRSFKRKLIDVLESNMDSDEDCCGDLHEYLNSNMMADAIILFLKDYENNPNQLKLEI